MSDKPHQEYYVGQCGEKTRDVSAFRMLPDIAGCTTYGIKGTVSAAELSVLRARMEGGRRNKALRGELWSRVAIGFVRDRCGIRKNPDERVQTAILSVFARFREAGTARQATRLLREAGEQIPVRSQPDAVVTWEDASYERVLRIVKNPAMGGAYAYGLRRGIGHGMPLRPVSERWEILQPGRHEGYVSWPQWLEVQDQLERNHTRPQGARGPAREGRALLQGLAVCGQCGHAMSVHYNQRGSVYQCSRMDKVRFGPGSCGSVGGKRIDAALARLFVETATPAGAEAARQAAREVAERDRLALRRWEQALEHCRYEARLAERRYRQVDPDNRLIAATLERDWEHALIAVKQAEDALEAARSRQPEPPPPELFTNLGASIARVWEAPSTTMADRKRLLGCLVEEVVLQIDREARQVIAVVHWRGGRLDEITLPLIVQPPQPKRDDTSTVELVRKLSHFYRDRETARILNRQGRRTARGLAFSAELVRALRQRHDIPAHVPDNGDDGHPPKLLSVGEAAHTFGVHEATLYRWIHAGVVPVAQPDVGGAPLRVPMTEELRARLCETSPEGFVPVAVAMTRLGVSRQSIWNRIKSAELASCHVTHGKARGLYVRLPDEADLPLFQALSQDTAQ